MDHDPHPSLTHWRLLLPIVQAYVAGAQIEECINERHGVWMLITAQNGVDFSAPAAFYRIAKVSKIQLKKRKS